MYFTVWPGGYRECWPVMHGVMSLRPCPHSLPCQANDDDADNEKEEEEQGTLRTWLIVWISVTGGITDVCVGMKQEEGKQCVNVCMCFSRTYLIIVVVGQTLSVESHPPPLENTISATRRVRCKFNPSGSFSQTEPVWKGKRAKNKPKTVKTVSQ